MNNKYGFVACIIFIFLAIVYLVGGIAVAVQAIDACQAAGYPQASFDVLLRPVCVTETRIPLTEIE